MDWNPLINNLRGEQIVPVIGYDLSLVKDEKDKLVPLNRYIARKLTGQLKIRYEGQTVGELALKHRSANIPLSVKTIYNEIDEERFYTEPLEKLAQIGDFKFYISTTLDDRLAEALREVRSPGQLKVIDYSLGQMSDDSTYSDEEEEAPVTVFNLLGSFENVTASAINDEEMLEYIFTLSGKQSRHQLAQYFLRRVKDKSLLFIGCDFEDWFMRFIIRILTNRRYEDQKLNDYLVPGEVNYCPELHQFLKPFGTNIFLLDKSVKRNVQMFVDQLHERWMEWEKNRPKRYDGRVFLSYNNPDREKVEKVKKLLVAKGIQSVWLDVDNLASGKHRELIEKEIWNCNVFIPMISDNALTNSESYMWAVEGKTIKDRLKVAKYNPAMSFNVIPIILDKTKRGDERIPQFIRDFSMWELDKKKDRIIEEIVKGLTPLS